MDRNSCGRRPGSARLLWHHGRNVPGGTGEAENVSGENTWPSNSQWVCLRVGALHERGGRRGLDRGFL